MSVASHEWRHYKAEFDALSSSVWDSKEAVKNSVCSEHCIDSIPRVQSSVLHC